MFVVYDTRSLVGKLAFYITGRKMGAKENCGRLFVSKTTIVKKRRITFSHMLNKNLDAIFEGIYMLGVDAPCVLISIYGQTRIKL